MIASHACVRVSGSSFFLGGQWVVALEWQLRPFLVALPLHRCVMYEKTRKMQASPSKMALWSSLQQQRIMLVGGVTIVRPTRGVWGLADVCVVRTVRLWLRVATRRTWPAIYSIRLKRRSVLWPWPWLCRDAVCPHRAHAAKPWNGAPQHGCGLRNGCLIAWFP